MNVRVRTTNKEKGGVGKGKVNQSFWLGVRKKGKVLMEA